MSRMSVCSGLACRITTVWPCSCASWFQMPLESCVVLQARRLSIGEFQTGQSDCLWSFTFKMCVNYVFDNCMAYNDTPTLTCRLLIVEDLKLREWSCFEKNDYKKKKKSLKLFSFQCSSAAWLGLPCPNTNSDLFISVIAAGPAASLNTRFAFGIKHQEVSANTSGATESRSLISKTFFLRDKTGAHNYNIIKERSCF